MNKVTTLLCLFVGLMVTTATLSAQQDAQYTQFMYNKLAFNPGVAGLPESTEFRVIGRQQWLGLDEAPSSQIFSFNTPLTSAGTGVAARFNRVTIGLEQQYAIDAAYAYRIPLGGGARLGLGASVSARYMSIEYQNARPIQGNGDIAIPGAMASKVLPNFGAGVYVDAPNYYLGFSLPRLLQGDIDFGEEETIISREVRHFYFMGGMKFRLSEKLTLEPQALAKFVNGAPFDADFNLTAYLGSNLFTGISYRLGGNGGGESASVMAGTYLSEHLSMCLAYDIGLSELNTAQSGSIEVVVAYSIGGRSEAGTVVDPRNL